jgi:hypothetical protein
MTKEIKFIQLDYTVKSTINSTQDKFGYLYIHKRLDTGYPFYVGISFDKNFSRAKDMQGRNPHWKRIVKKHGYKIEIVFQKLPSELLYKKEIEFIKIFGRVDLGTGMLSNMCDGGKSITNYSPTEDQRRKRKYNNIKNFIVQYDLSGNLIYIWRSMRQYREVGFDTNMVKMSCEYGNSYANYIWKYIKNTNLIGYECDNFTKPYKIRNESPKIIQIDYANEIVNIYNNVTEIYALGFQSKGVLIALKDVNRMSGGYKFQYFDMNIHNIDNIDKSRNFLPKLHKQLIKVVKLDINYNPIVWYNSLSDAIKYDNITEWQLGHHLKCGKLNNNHYWQYYDFNKHGKLKFNDEILIDTKKICQIGKDGYIINIFDNLKHLFDLDYNIHWIKNIIGGFEPKKKCYYLWKYYEESDDLSKCEYKYFKVSNKTKKPIIHFNELDNFIQLYDGTSDVDTTKFIPDCVSKCCIGKSQTHNNHRFRFLKDYIDENPNFEPKTENDINVYEKFIFDQKHKIIYEN